MGPVRVDQLVDAVGVEVAHLRDEARPADRSADELLVRLLPEHGEGGVPHRGDDDRPGVDQRAVEIEEDDAGTRMRRDRIRRRQCARLAAYRSRDPARRILDALEDRAPTAAPSHRASERGRPSSSRANRSGSRLEHRPDERPHHVAQERVGRDREVELVAAALPRRRADLATEHLVLRLRRRERREVVLAERAPPRRRASAPRRAARGHQSARRASSGDRAPPVERRRSGRSAPSPRTARGSRPARSSAASDGDVVAAAPCSAPRPAASTGGPPSACEARDLPGRVNARCRSGRRPRGRSSRGRTASSASRTAPSTVRSPGWRAQPRNPVPSYSSVSLQRGHGRVVANTHSVYRLAGSTVERRGRRGRVTTTSRPGSTADVRPRLPDLAVEPHLAAGRQRAARRPTPVPADERLDPDGGAAALRPARRRRRRLGDVDRCRGEHDDPRPRRRTGRAPR